MPGDLVKISSVDCKINNIGYGLYLGRAVRGQGFRGLAFYSFWFKGQFKTFDQEWWIFEVWND